MNILLKKNVMFYYDLTEEEANFILSTYRNLLEKYKKLLDKRNFVINKNTSLNNRVPIIHNRKSILSNIVYLYKINLIHIIDYLSLFLSVMDYNGSHTLNDAIGLMISSLDTMYNNKNTNNTFLEKLIINKEYVQKYCNDSFNETLNLYHEVDNQYFYFDAEMYKTMIIFLESLFKYMIYNVKDGNYTLYILYLKEMLNDPIRFYDRIVMNNVINNLKDYFDMIFLPNKMEFITK